MSWQSDVVDRMLELKHTGVEFDAAWNEAMVLHPPRGRDLGPLAPSLFDVDGDATSSVVGFFYGACSDAWHGRRPALQHFHPSLLIERDATGPAGRQSRLAA